MKRARVVEVGSHALKIAHCFRKGRHIAHHPSPFLLPRVTTLRGFEINPLCGVSSPQELRGLLKCVPAAQLLQSFSIHLWKKEKRVSLVNHSARRGAARLGDA